MIIIQFQISVDIYTECLMTSVGQEGIFPNNNDSDHRLMTSQNKHFVAVIFLKF